MKILEKISKEIVGENFWQNVVDCSLIICSFGKNIFSEEEFLRSEGQESQSGANAPNSIISFNGR